ncbi:uncharacterized protein LODBEIA_P18420 [Lodderomyces beijingensis]|uniref:RCC1-like domain-containing protein n=1 Tax=Lodderomyces beijingensis TaxID=1775926 RepID=A0ABP0ZHI6_9ASCO
MYTVLACGSNGNYQLGLDNNDDQSQLRPSVFSSQSEFSSTRADAGTETRIEAKPKKIACGGNHTLILLENGKVFSCGSNEYGQTGHPVEEEAFIATFRAVPDPPDGAKWIAIACAWECSFFIDDYNRLYSCGNGAKGELGLGTSTRCQRTIAQVRELGADIVKIHSSMSHVVVQTSSGKLFGWGSCKKGQLGVMDKQSVTRGAVWEPVELNFEAGVDSAQVDDFQTGRDFTVVLATERSQGPNRLTIWGKSTVDVEKANREIEQGAGHGGLAAMWSSVHWKSLKRGIISFGTDTHGQLFDYALPHPERAHKLDFTVGSEHGLLLSMNKVYAWGWGEHGNCGEPSLKNTDGITYNYLNPIYEGPQEVVLIAGGCATSWVVIKAD